MRNDDRRRLALAAVFSILAHTTALVVLLPVLASIRAIKALVAPDSEALRVSLVLAILLHLVILLPLTHWLITRDVDADADQRFVVDLWSRDLAQDREFEQPEEEKTPEEELEEYEPEEEIPEGQVVQAPPSPDKRRPEDARFLAEQDSRVERESASKMRTPGSGQASATPQMPDKGKDAESKPGGMITEQHGVAPMPSDLARAEEGEDSAEKRAPPSLADINLEPSMSAMTAALAGTGLDHLEDVIAGDHTALNTAGWDYASFFNRVKRKVEQYWHPDVEFKRRDPYGNIYGFKDRVTVLLVVLRGDGSLKKLYVMQPSGAPFLDDEAYEAVSQSAPFPNVPHGLMDKRDGLVKFTFHFIVEVGAAPVFRMRRYR
jgi:TonB family protein